MIITDDLNQDIDLNNIKPEQYIAIYLRKIIIILYSHYCNGDILEVYNIQIKQSKLLFMLIDWSFQIQCQQLTLQKKNEIEQYQAKLYKEISKDRSIIEQYQAIIDEEILSRNTRLQLYDGTYTPPDKPHYHQTKSYEKILLPMLYKPQNSVRELQFYHTEIGYMPQGWKNSI